MNTDSIEDNKKNISLNSDEIKENKRGLDITHAELFVTTKIDINNMQTAI